MSYKPVFAPFQAAPGLARHCIWDKDGDFVAELSDAHDDADTAWLLAAAPELMEALEDVLNYDGGADSALEDEYVMERAQESLAKARGEDQG